MVEEQSVLIANYCVATYGQKWDLIILPRHPHNFREDRWLEVLHTRLRRGGRIIVAEVRAEGNPIVEQWKRAVHTLEGVQGFIEVVAAEARRTRDLYERKSLEALAAQLQAVLDE